MSDKILEITDANFSETVKKSESPVLVDFWAPWCGPCRMMAPVLEEMAGEYPATTLAIGKLNVDENQATAKDYGVMSIPTLVVFKGGEVAGKIVGFKPKAELKKAVDALL